MTKKSLCSAYAAAPYIDFITDRKAEDVLVVQISHVVAVDEKSNFGDTNNDANPLSYILLGPQAVYIT